MPATAREVGFQFAAPPAGLFGWVAVGADTDTDTDTDTMAQALLDLGWLAAPGTLFHATPWPTTPMRVNFATSQDARFWRPLRQCVAAVTAPNSAPAPAPASASASVSVSVSVFVSVSVSATSRHS